MKKMGIVKACAAGVCVGAFLGGAVGAAMDGACAGGCIRALHTWKRKIRRML